MPVQRFTITGGASLSLWLSDSRDVLCGVAENSIDSIVTDPPYALDSVVKRFGGDNAAPAQSGKSGVYARSSAGFMGQKWDTGDVAFAVSFWEELYRVLKPGGYVLAFGGTRTYHRLACAIEDAGFEIRDQIGWAFGSGFPKSHDVSKGIDKAAGAERATVGFDSSKVRPNRVDRGLVNSAGGSGFNADNGATLTAPATEEAKQWQGWGTALKPAWEPICVARKPLIGTVAANVLRYGTGALNIDGCRVPGEKPDTTRGAGGQHGTYSELGAQGRILDDGKGRWPANLIHDGSPEVLAAFPQAVGAIVDGSTSDEPKTRNVYSLAKRGGKGLSARGDAGSAARFFYCPKASKADRNDGCANTHPTVKPTELMRYLCRLVTPPGGSVLDPFMGSGSTGRGAVLEGFSFLGIEQDAGYWEIAKARVAKLVLP